MKKAETRPYRMTVRAERAAATRERILDAVIDLFWERPTDRIALSDVAERAGVTVQTVIRRFGTKDGLMAAAVQRAVATTNDERRVPVDDPDKAIDVLLDHYERLGRPALRLLAAEESSPQLSAYADVGRRQHRAWCADAFPAALAGLSEPTRTRRLAQIAAVCDVYTWKLLHLDAGLNRAETHRAILELLEPFLVISGDH